MFFETTALATTALLATAGWLPTGLRWAQSSLPVPYCISANATNTNVNANNQRAAVLQGINAWVSSSAGGSLSCSNYTAVPATQACTTSINTQDGRPNVFWTRNWRNGSGTIGVTWSVGNGRSCGQVTDSTGRRHNLGCKHDSDIELNDVNFFWTDTGRNGTDIASIMAHEYGHFIGLDHCNDNGTCNFGQAVMYASYGGGAIRVPFNDDVAGACGLYPGTPGGLGWPCTGSGQCTTGICVTPGPTGYCSQTCGNCPQGYACRANPSNPNQQVCLRDDGLNQDVCEVCQTGSPNACANGGLCIRGIPENNTGRCVLPCGPNDSCDARFQCLGVQFQDGSSGDYCFPRSNNCNDLNNFTELQLGQRCTGNPPCSGNLTCVGICSPSCNPGTCPADWGCEQFQGGQSYCLPSVNEGQSCEGLVSCATGPCLMNPTSRIATCYMDCAGNPGACNNAQQCRTYNLQGGGSVSICEPPGVPPRPPDAGVVLPDAGPEPAEDAGPGADGGTPVNPDSGTPGVDAGTDPGVCACDLTYSCDSDGMGGDCACDPECLCECDVSFACDPGCAHCDPECRQGVTANCGQCSSLPGEPHPGATLLGLLVLAGLSGLRLLRRR